MQMNPPENTSNLECGARDPAGDKKIEIDGEDEEIIWTDDEVEDEQNASTSVEVDAPSTSSSSLFTHFVGMGFSKERTSQAIRECGEESADLVLERLLTYSTLNESPKSSDFAIGSSSSLSSNGGPLGDSQLKEALADSLSEEEKKFMVLVEMGFEAEEVASVMDRCKNSSLIELQDFLYATRFEEECGPDQQYPTEKVDDTCYRVSEERDENLPENSSNGDGINNDHCAVNEDINPSDQYLEFSIYNVCGNNNQEGGMNNNKRKISSAVHDDELEAKLSKQMIGFGIPELPNYRTRPQIPKAGAGPPYFYFENVAYAPTSVWGTISRFLYDIQPEYVDSLHFSATARKRGYIHNLPIEGRRPLEPRPPMTIQEAIPQTRKWWPSWDPRTKLNCLLGKVANPGISDKIRILLSESSLLPDQKLQRYIIDECRKNNLVWVGLNRVASLEPDEIEILLGFPVYHTRGGGVTREERIKSLGDSFQVDTVAYHFSVLKSKYPNGIRVLSLFSGIGGAEIALHRLGIPLKAVVAVEISQVKRNIFRCWWEATQQTGMLEELDDVKDLNVEKIENLVSRVGGFDLVVGGSPCNNISGANRISRNGLEGEHSSLFFEYSRILYTVRDIMARASGTLA